MARDAHGVADPQRFPLRQGDPLVEAVGMSCGQVDRMDAGHAIDDVCDLTVFGKHHRVTAITPGGRIWKSHAPDFGPRHSQHGQCAASARIPLGPVIIVPTFMAGGEDLATVVEREPLCRMGEVRCPEATELGAIVPIETIESETLTC